MVILLKAFYICILVFDNDTSDVMKSITLDKVKILQIYNKIKINKGKHKMLIF